MSSGARTHIHSLGLYGPVSVEHLTSDRLPYVENLVNLIVAEDLGKVPMGEVLRSIGTLGCRVSEARREVVENSKALGEGNRRVDPLPPRCRQQRRGPGLAGWSAPAVAVVLRAAMVAQPRVQLQPLRHGIGQGEAVLYRR